MYLHGLCLIAKILFQEIRSVTKILFRVIARKQNKIETLLLRLSLLIISKDYYVTDTKRFVPLDLLSHRNRRGSIYIT